MPEHSGNFSPMRLVALASPRVSPEPWAVAAHRVYRLGGRSGLLRFAPVSPKRGGYLAADDQNFRPQCPPQRFVSTVVGECRTRGYQGAVLDLTSSAPPLGEWVELLDGAFARLGLELLVPEQFAPAAPHGRLFLPSAQSGGRFARRMEEACRRYGADRVVLALERMAEDFPLPAPTGAGTPLSPQALAEQREGLPVFFSPPLCARYFTHRDGEGRPRLTLFDDGETLGKKIALAQQAGVSCCLGDWAELADFLPQLRYCFEA